MSQINERRSAIREGSPTTSIEDGDIDIQDDGSSDHGALIVSVQSQTSEEQVDVNDTDGMAVSLVDDNDPGCFGKQSTNPHVLNRLLTEINCIAVGPTSNISLMRIIFQVVARRGYVRDSLKFPSTGKKYTGAMANPSRLIPGSPSKAEIGSCNQLPPDHRTRTLIRHYFSTTGMLFPYIHEPSFLETYENLKKKNFRVGARRTWLALLNIMLAMASCGGCQDAENTKTMESEIFYRRAQELCGSQMLAGATLETGETKY